MARMLRTGIVLCCYLLGQSTNAESFADDEVVKDSQLIWACMQTEKDWIGYCNGYLTAIRDAMQREFGGGEKQFCAPKGAGANVLFDSYLKYQKVRNSMEKSDSTGTVLEDPPALISVTTAYLMFFPCK